MIYVLMSIVMIVTALQAVRTGKLLKRLLISEVVLCTLFNPADGGQLFEGFVAGLLIFNVVSIGMYNYLLCKEMAPFSKAAIGFLIVVTPWIAIMWRMIYLDHFAVW